MGISGADVVTILVKVSRMVVSSPSLVTVKIMGLGGVYVSVVKVMDVRVETLIMVVVSVEIYDVVVVDTGMETAL